VALLIAKSAAPILAAMAPVLDHHFVQIRDHRRFEVVVAMGVDHLANLHASSHRPL
jgi:hypothetical protein